MIQVKPLFVFVCLLSTQVGMLSAQDATTTSTDAKLVVFSVQQDHQNMMKQLGITKLRPGRSSNPSDRNAANTDESKANPYPELPELMTMKDGTKVTTPDQWWKRRRPEIVEDFQREVVGRIPDGVPSVKWKVLKTIEKKLTLKGLRPQRR